jgi:hypothetical protein
MLNAKLILILAYFIWHIVTYEILLIAGWENQIMVSRAVSLDEMSTYVMSKAGTKMGTRNKTTT